MIAKYENLIANSEKMLEYARSLPEVSESVESLYIRMADEAEAVLENLRKVDSL